MKMPNLTNPPWSRDELILALDLYLKYRNSPPGKTSPEVIELSQLLNTIGRSIENRQEDFRNPNGVYMKMMNFRSLDPVFISSKKKGLTSVGDGDRIVWRDYSENPSGLSDLAKSIRANISSESAEPHIYFDYYVTEAIEGNLLTRQHIMRERNRSLTEKKNQQLLNRKGNWNVKCADLTLRMFMVSEGEDLSKSTTSSR